MIEGAKVYNSAGCLIAWYNADEFITATEFINDDDRVVYYAESADEPHELIAVETITGAEFKADNY